ncbi:MAG: molybdenum cofactor guanylyltransferase MobA [Pseudomonadota bacterium]|jgi:molybdopterin-guanine dinucleotide biosynthesis protein A
MSDSRPIPAAAGIPRSAVTGLVLAGGRGSRMGGVDKGLQQHAGLPLAQHALQRLRPQVGALMVNANRNLEVYRAMGAPVWPDAWPEYPGPLAGMAAGLDHCTTPWLATVPCDTPGFPQDLVERLRDAVCEQGAELAMAATRDADDQVQLQPVFCLLGTALLPSLQAFLQRGQRKIDRWTALHRCAVVVFERSEDFDNANTPEELERIGRLNAGRSGPGS